jgi:hypothetical protein
MSMKPLKQEAEYFARLEFARRQQALVEQASQAAEEERQRVFTAVQQHCPTCGAPLVTVTYRSIVIDKCLRCQGVWLDCDEFLFFGEGTRTCLGKRSMVTRRAETELDLSGYRRVVLLMRMCPAPCADAGAVCSDALWRAGDASVPLLSSRACGNAADL